MKGGLLLDVVVGQGAAILQLLTSENQSLLIRRNTFLILNLLLDILDGVGGIDIKSDGLARQGLDEDLHTRSTTQTKHQVKGGLLLDVVVGQGAAILQLLTSENQSLLIRRDTFLVLNLLLDILDRVRGVDIKSDGLACKGLDEDLHTRSTTQT